jgi:hypothetical protein
MANKLCFFILVCLFAFCGKKQNNGKPYIKFLYEQPGRDNNGPVEYRHYLVIENCPDKPDSALVMNLASQYLKALVKYKPANHLCIFRSDDRFIPNEQSQVWSDVNKDCIVEIYYSNDKFESYIFYDKSGENSTEQVYWKKEDKD